MKEKILIFGTGNYYKLSKEILSDFFEILAFVDNNKEKQDTVFENKKVICPEKIKEIPFDKIFIASMYIDEITEQLIKLGIEEDKIISDATYMPVFYKKISRIKYKKDFQSRNKKHILFCVSNLNGGGAERVLIDILDNFNYEKYEVTLLVLFKEGVYFDKINKNVNMIVIFNSDEERVFGHSIIKKMNPDIIYRHIVKIKSDVEIAFLEGEASKVISGSNGSGKKVAWVHIDLKENHWTKCVFKSLQDEKECYERFNNVVCVSEGVKKSLIELFDLNKEKVNVIYNMFEIEKIMRLSNEPIYNIDQFDGFTFCAAGRLDRQKGFDRLIKVHAKLIRENLKHHIIILGRGKEENKLLELVKKLRVEDSVHFLGFKDNPYKFMMSSDAFILSSRAEGFPLVLCEALILGKPVVSTECCGVKEILSDGEYGMVVDNSEDGIYNGMKSMICNKNLINKYKKMAQIRRGFFNKDKVMEDIESLFDTNLSYIEGEKLNV
ncbi:hypothetical protein NL50_02130 [Clostridium acetobutylicum]|nr:hypothetical protein NL50_02130 [Clostridium acetobutylicum]